jgi:glycosyltransferase involved in cell wall biosynthesis
MAKSVLRSVPGRSKRVDSAFRPVLSIVLPARNEAVGIERAVRETDALLADLGLPYEIIVGDSASTDDTGTIALALNNPRVRVIRADEAGKGRILTRALSAARGVIVGFIDSDLEIPVDYLQPAVVAVMRGADAAIGSKALDPARAAKRSALRRSITDVANRVIRFSLGTTLSDHQAGMKVFRRDSLLPMLNRVRATGWLWDTELLALMNAAGHRIEEIPVETSEARPSRFGSIRQIAAAGLELTAVCARVRLRRWLAPAPMPRRNAGALHTVR